MDPRPTVPHGLFTLVLPGDDLLSPAGGNPSPGKGIPTRYRQLGPTRGRDRSETTYQQCGGGRRVLRKQLGSN